MPKAIPLFMRTDMVMKSTRNYTALILLVILGISCGVLAGAFFGLTQDLPQIRQLKSFEPSAVTRIHDTEGVILAELFVEKRNPVPLSRMPYFLKAGLLATEDRNFYKHSGVDLKGIFRAIIRDIRAGEFVEGASTITQQLARTLFLTSKKTLIRKLKEAIIAFQIERRYTKDEILELYLNQIYLGSGAYGVESAANIFFEKSIESLNLAECALIAAMPKAPSRYSPLIDHELALRRRNIVLKQMLEIGIIERAFQQRMEGGCQVPLGCHATRDGERVQIRAFVSAPEGAPFYLQESTGSRQEGVALAQALADRLLEMGGREILNELKGKL